MAGYSRRNLDVYASRDEESSGDTFYTGSTFTYPLQNDVIKPPYQSNGMGIHPLAKPSANVWESYSSKDKSSKRSKKKSREAGKKSQDHKAPIKAIANRFADNTSMVGVSYIQKTETWYGKAAWVFFLLCGLAAMTFHLYHLSSTYFAWPKKTTVVLGFESLRFPAVTVCNINPVKMSKLHLANKEFRTLMNSVTAENLANKIEKRRMPPPPTAAPGPTATDTNQANAATTTAPRIESSTFQQQPAGRRKKRFVELDYNYTNPYDRKPPAKDGQTDAWKDKGKKLPQAQMLEDFVSMFSGIKRKTRIKMGHHIKDMLLKCSFAGMECFADNFTVSTTTTFGNCFTLQYEEFISRRSGPQEGMELWFNLEKAEFLRGWTNSDGLHVAIHHYQSLPMVETDGFAVSAATETFIALQLLNIERLTQPYGECDDGVAFENMYNLVYSRQVCQTFCEQNLIMEHCGCIDGRQDEVNVQMKVKDKYSPCSESAEILCMNEIKLDFEFNRKSCICLNQCSETKYRKTLSSRPWPSEEYGKVLIQQMCFKNESHCRRFQMYSHEQLSKDFVKMNIYFEDLNYQNITEEIDYELSQFLSDIGGTIGLWIGLSVLSLCEVGQLFLEICLHFGKVKK